MRGKEHLAFGITTSTALAFAMCSPESAILPNTGLAIVLGSIGSLLPDGLDKKESMLGRYLKPIASLNERLFGHRNLMHDILFWAIIAAVLTYFCPMTFALWFGVAGHLFLDSMTKSGICFGYFFTKRFVNGEIRTKRLWLLPRWARMSSSGTAAIVTSWAMCIAIAYLSFPMIAQVI